MKLVFYSGVMRGGKTLRLIQKIDLITDTSKERTTIIKPIQDTRDRGFVKSRGTDIIYPCLTIDETDVKQKRMLTRHLLTGTDVLFIDEAQFFSKAFIELIYEICAAADITIYASGLLEDFNQKRFESSDFLLENSDGYIFYTSDCYKCGEPSTHNVLLTETGERYVSTNGNNILPEGDVSSRYETVCDCCLLELNE
jgi:Thymidine kinase